MVTKVHPPMAFRNLTDPALGRTAGGPGKAKSNLGSTEGRAGRWAARLVRGGRVGGSAGS